MTVLLRVAYDGTDFHGFARQESARTVQGALEMALAGLYHAPIRTRAASRTDAGVHALGQIVGFEPTLVIPMRGLVLGLTSTLPGDIGVLAAWPCALPDGRAVDPRFYNLGKRYRYQIRCTPQRVPTTGRGEWHVARPLDVPAMQAAARLMVGEHDFASFRASACQARTTVRRVVAVEVTASAGEEPLGPGSLVQPPAPIVTITVRGEAFLQNMVRIMVGTLVDVGRGRWPPEYVRSLLARPDRTRAGSTAPPQGLTLMEVYWPELWPPDDWARRDRGPMSGEPAAAELV